MKTVYDFMEQNGKIFFSTSPNPGGSDSKKWRKDTLSGYAVERGVSVKPGKIARLPLGNAERSPISGNRAPDTLI